MWKRKAEKQRKREEDRKEQQEDLEMVKGLEKFEQLDASDEREKKKKGGRLGVKKKMPESEMTRKNVKEDKKQKNKQGEKEDESSSSSDSEFIPPDMSSPRMRERRNAVIESTCRVPFERARSADRSRKQSPSGSPFGKVTRVLSPKSTGPPIHVDDSRKFRRDVLDDIAKFKRALYMQPTKLRDELAETSKVERRECQSLGGYSPQRRREQSAAAATRRTRSATSSPRITVGSRPKTSSTSIPGTSKIPRSIRDVKRLLNSLSVSSCEIHTKTDETSSSSSEDTPKKSKKGFKWFRRIRKRASSKPRVRSRSLEDFSVLDEFKNVWTDSSRAVASMVTKPSKWFSKRHKPKSKKQKAKEFIEEVFNIKIDELKIVKLMKEKFGTSSSEETTSTEVEEDEPSTSKKSTSTSKKILSIFKKDSSSPSKKDAGPSKKDASPSKKDAGPSKRDPGPSKRDAAPPKRDVAPPKRDAGPSKRDAGPFKRDAGPSKTDVSPSKRDPGPSKRDAGPSKIDASPSKRDPGPSKRDAGPSKMYSKSGRK